jgi:DNA recombination protein RmuC
MEPFSSIVFLLVGIAAGLAGYYTVVARSSVSRRDFDQINSKRIAAEARLVDIVSENASLKEQQQEFTRRLEEAARASAILETEGRTLEERISQQQKDFENIQKQLTLHFQNLANQIFQEKSTTFKEQAASSLSDLLLPLREKIAEFHNKVDDSFGKHFIEQNSLKREIERIVGVNQQMTAQTESLTRALKGDSKAQGIWGEIILARILEESGLKKGTHYSEQGEGQRLKHHDNGQPLRPDIIVNLPEDKHIIIDSKVSLFHYERFCAEEDQAQKQLYLKELLKSIRQHVDGLASRGYQNIEALSTPEVVLMFFPLEGAFFLALQSDPEIHSYAWNKKIAIVCPTTLFVALKTIESFWRVDLQNNNALKIAKQAGEIYDKIANIVEDLQRLGKQINTAGELHDSVMKRLAEGRGNVLSKVEKLRLLGAKTSKSLPKDLLGGDQEEEVLEPLKVE